MNSPALETLRSIAGGLCGGHYEPKPLTAEQAGKLGGELLDLVKAFEREQEEAELQAKADNDCWNSGCGGCGCG